MLGRIRHMLKKEFIQVFRDPRTRFVIFVAPIVQTLLFGYAVSTDIHNAPTAIYDQDNTPASRELVSRFTNSGYFRLVANVTSDAEARHVLDISQAVCVIHLDHGFSEDLNAAQPARPAEVQLLLDGTDSNTASIVAAYANTVITDLSREIVVRRTAIALGRAAPAGRIDLVSRTWFNENLISRNYYVPGIIAMLVTLVTLLLTSMSVVREKEAGTIEQIAVTPISRTEFILGKTVPFAILGFIDVLLVTAVGVYWFGVPIHGNLGWLLLGTAAFLLPSLSLGLLISTLCRTQQQALMTTFLFLMPANLLSGFVFPIANMPEPVQWLTYLNPLRYFLTIIRGTFLKGVGIEVLWPNMAALVAIGLVAMVLAIMRFRKTMG
jgi:ABC-2 type transport system permease protein